MRKIILLLSGGLDSVTLLHQLKDQGHEIHCLLFDYRQRHKRELQCAIDHARRLNVRWTVVDLPELGGLTEQSWVVPNRNAVFLSVAVNFACQRGFDAVAIGCNADDAQAFPDCREEFIGAMNAAVRAAGYNVEILAPFINLKKWQIGGMAREMGVQPQSVWTCYQGGIEPCGKCPACLKFEQAL